MRRELPTRYEENFPGSDYSDEEREFLQAIDRYKRENCRPFPTWREVLRLAKQLGYRKVAPPAVAARKRSPPPEDEGVTR